MTMTAASDIATLLFKGGMAGFGMALMWSGNGDRAGLGAIIVMLALAVQL